VKTSRRILYRFLLVLASLVMALLLSEIGVRVLVPKPYWKFRDASMDWRLDPDSGWVQKPGLDVTTRNDEGRLIRFRTNEDGLTPAEARRQKVPGTFRILLVGDSTVVGRAVPQHATLHFFLQSILRARGIPAEVINAGVEGYSTDQALIRLRRLVPLYHPDLVLYGLCSNDFGGNAVDTAYGIPKPRFRLEGGRLKEVPPDLSSARIATFGSGPGKWLQYLAVYRLAHVQITLVRSWLGGWEHLNLLSPASEIYYRPEALDKVDWTLLAALLREMRDISRRNGARFLFYAHPDLAEVWDPYIRVNERRLGIPSGRYDRYALQRRLQRLAVAESVHFCGLIERFAAHQERGPFHLLPRDPHCNPTGYAVTAEALAECLLMSVQ
jgi:lysophospholipase L1-like esterase